MATISTETFLNTAADDAWEIISCFNGAIKYFTLVVKSTREGNGAGSVRTISLADGSSVVEGLEMIEELSMHCLASSIVSSTMPIQKYFATMKVEGIDNDSCKMVWSCTFTPKGVSDAEALDMVSEIYKKGSMRLEALYSIE